MIKLLRVAAIVGGFIWAISVMNGWAAYADMVKYGSSTLFASSIESAKTALIIQSFLAAGLFLFGVFYKPKNTPKAGIPHPDTHIRCPDCKEFVLKEASVCKHCGCKLVPQ